MQRRCGTCSHKDGEQCRHPQAKNLWGRLNGMDRYLPDRKWPVWPQALAEGACGWWRPAKEIEA